MRKRPHSRLIDDMLLHLDADESWLVLLALRRLEPAALAEREDAVVTILEDADWWVRILALETLGALGPAVLAQHVDAVVARLDDSESSVRAAALETLLGLEEAVLAQHAGAIFARLEAVRLLWDEDTEGLVRSATSSINRMLRTVGEQPPAHHIEALLDPDPEERDFALRALCKLEPATLAQHAVAIVAMLGEPTEKCQILQKLEPAALAQHADAVAAMLEDEDRGHVWSAALETLARLEPAVLAQYADAVAAKLEEHEAFEVWSAALVTLARLEPPALAQYADAVVAKLEQMDYEVPHEVGMEALLTLQQLEPADLAPYASTVAYFLDHFGRAFCLQALWTLEKLEPATLAQHANAVIEQLEFAVPVHTMAMYTLRGLPRFILTVSILDLRPMRSRLLGRLAWYKFRLHLRAKHIALYWYALPYRPSGPGHARDVEAWGQLVENRDELEGTTSNKRHVEERGKKKSEKKSKKKI